MLMCEDFRKILLDLNKKVLASELVEGVYVYI